MIVTSPLNLRSAFGSRYGRAVMSAFTACLLLVFGHVG